MSATLLWDRLPNLASILATLNAFKTFPIKAAPSAFGLSWLALRVVRHTPRRLRIFIYLFFLTAFFFFFKETDGRLPQLSDNQADKQTDRTAWPAANYVPVHLATDYCTHAPLPLGASAQVVLNLCAIIIGFVSVVSARCRNPPPPFLSLPTGQASNAASRAAAAA